MSSESSELDNFSSTEDTEFTEFSRSGGFSDSGSNSDFTASGRRSVKESETEEGEVNEVVTTSLITSDEKQHEFDIERKSLSSLEGISPEDLNTTKKPSTDREANALTRKASSVERPLIRNRPSQDCLEKPSTRMASSLDLLNEPSARRLSSVDPLEGPSSTMVSFLDALNGSLTRSVSSVDPLEGPLSRMASSPDLLNEPSTGNLSSVNPLERSSSRMDSSLNALNGSSTRSVSSMDPVEGPTDKRTSSLDPLRGYSTRRVSFMNPLEGPSTQTVWFPDSTEGSSTDICNLHNLEIETTEPSFNEHPTEPSVSCCRRLADFLRRSSRQIRSSKCYLLFNVALLALPFSAGYMGSRYEKLCDACRGLPMMVLGLGYFGVILITLRIASILSKYHFVPPMPRRGFNTSLMFVCIPFIPFLMNESHVTYTCDPVFTPSKANKKFCIKVFYDYAYYLNEIIPFVIILLILIHIPGWFDPDEDEEE